MTTFLDRLHCGCESETVHLSETGEVRKPPYI